MAWWSSEDDGIVLQVRATPGARRSEVIGVVDGVLRIKVAAPATEGKANAELRRVLARWLGVRPAAVALVRGDRARRKVVHVSGVASPPPT